MSFRHGFFFILLFVAVLSASAKKTAYVPPKKNIPVQSYLPEPDLPVAKAAKSAPPIAVIPIPNPHILVSDVKEGIDVSHYQGNIDWQTVTTKNKIGYAYLKATEGASLVDDTYDRNLRGAKQYGLKVGSYHFYRPNVSVDDQFANLTSVVKASEQDLVPIIDVEHKGRVSDEQFIRDLNQFLEKVTRHYGRKPLIYTFQNFYNRHLKNKISGYKWMIAKYHDEMPVLEDGQDFVIWQYSSTSRIPGIRGNVDRSIIMDNYSLADILF